MRTALKRHSGNILQPSLDMVLLSTLKSEMHTHQKNQMWLDFTEISSFVIYILLNNGNIQNKYFLYLWGRLLKLLIVEQKY